jgi:hypothetical protein
MPPCAFELWNVGGYDVKGENCIYGYKGENDCCCVFGNHCCATDEPCIDIGCMEPNKKKGECWKWGCGCYSFGCKVPQKSIGVSGWERGCCCFGAMACGWMAPSKEVPVKLNDEKWGKTAEMARV